MDEARQLKLKPWQHPSVVLTPNLFGMTVIEAKNGAESLIGQTFPWYRVDLDCTSGGRFVRLCNEQSKHLKINGKLVNGRFEGSPKLVSRLRDRAARKWANESSDSISYQPIGDHQCAWWFFFLFMFGGAVIVSYSSLAMMMPSMQQPMIMPTRIVLFTAFALIQLLAVGVPIFLWKQRPRHQDFVSLDFLPTGIVGTSATGEVTSLVFAELKSKKLIKNNPMQCRLETKNGHVYWIVLRRPMNVFAIRALYPGSDSRKKIVAHAVRHFYRLGVRFIIIGVVLSLFGNAFAHYLANTGAILPADVRRIRVGLVYFPLISSFLGLRFCGVAWKYSLSGQRTIKSIKARFSNSKEDDPKDTDS